MKDKYFIVEYNYLISKYKMIDKYFKEYIIKSCLNIALEAHFSTDYEDVKEHIFGNDNYLKLFIIEKSSDNIPIIKGFLVCDCFISYNDIKNLHCHGIILSPEVQGYGLSKDIIDYARFLTNPDVITAKTHNPRCFNSFISLNDIYDYYPNETGVIPDEIIKLCKANPFISNSDENLICRNAYPDIKIQQTKKNETINLIFEKINPYDAQSIVIILNPEKLSIETGIKRKELKR